MHEKSTVFGNLILRSLPVITIAVRHGEDISVEDAEFVLEGQDCLLAMVMFTTTTVRPRKGS